MPSQEDYDMFLLLSGGCSLDSSPKKNWVEEQGGLPTYICKIAKAVMKSGKSKSQAIAIAVSRVKKWAAGGDDVDADTRAKAAAAVAKWESMKAKNKAGNIVKATHSEQVEYLMLTYIPSFNMELVRSAWDSLERERRHDYEAVHPNSTDLAAPSSSLYPYRWIREVWTDYIIIDCEDNGKSELEKIPYRVHPLTREITFGDPIPVVRVYVEVEEDLNSSEKSLLSDIL